MTKISFILPAYNEEEGIAEVIKRFKKGVDGLMEYEIIVVDDASTDKTAEIALKEKARVITNPLNMGYGFSVKRGISEAKYEYLAIADADGTYPVEKILELTLWLDKGCDMVIGARRGKIYRSNLLKYPARLVFKWLAEFVTGKRIPDINSGLRVFKKSAILPILAGSCSGFSFSTSSTLIMTLQGSFIKYVPIDYFHRKGESKIRYFRDTLRTAQILTSVILRHNPIKLFLLISIFVFLLSFIFGGLAVLFSIAIFSLGLLAEASRPRP
jgi:glycosyltransferase involved in cell wall biosynthesis